MIAAVLRTAHQEHRPRALKSASRGIFPRSPVPARRAAVYGHAAHREIVCGYGGARQARHSLQTDPIGTRDDPNLYMYVGDDPLNYSDPKGLGKTHWLVETVKGIWRRVGTAKQAENARRAGKNVEVRGPRASREARRVEEGASGSDNTVRHDPHPNGNPAHKGTEQPHYQPARRPPGPAGRGHTFYGASAVAGTGFAVEDYVDPNNQGDLEVARAIDFWANPATDIADIAQMVIGPSPPSSGASAPPLPDQR